jgi:hypothetical protein
MLLVKRSNSSPPLPWAVKFHLQHAFGCPNPASCNKSSKSLNGLHIHFGKFPKCARFFQILPKTNKDGQNSATATASGTIELSHASENGIIPNCLAILFKEEYVIRKTPN